MPRFRLYLGDCRDVMRMFASASFDAVVCDPPYGENVASWDSDIDFDFHVRWITEASRVLKPYAPLIAFGSRRRFDLLMGGVRAVRGDSSECPLQMGVWNHRQGFGAATGYLRPEHEPFVVSGLLNVDTDEVRAMREYQTPHNMNRKPTHRGAESGMRKGFKAHTYTPHEVGPIAGTTFDAARNKFAEATGHECQKPVKVGRYLVALATSPGGRVLDPFCGSGSFGVASLELGREFTGIDSDAVNVERSRLRLRDVAPLFDLAGVQGENGERMPGEG